MMQLSQSEMQERLVSKETVKCVNVKAFNGIGETKTILLVDG